MTRRCRGSVYLGENGVCLRVGFGCDESHCLREPTQIYTSELMARPADGEGDQVRLGWRPAPAGGRSAPAERATSSGWESYQHRQGGRPALTERATSSDWEGDQLRLGGRSAPTGRAARSGRESDQLRQGERPAPVERATSSGRERPGPAGRATSTGWEGDHLRLGGRPAPAGRATKSNGLFLYFDKINYMQ